MEGTMGLGAESDVSKEGVSDQTAGQRTFGREKRQPAAFFNIM